MDAWETTIRQYIFWAVLTEIVFLVIFLYVLYLLTKAAVRDGINESRLGKRLGKQRTLYERSKDIKF